MFEALKKTLSETAKAAVQSYQEGRHAMDEATRKAFDRLGLPYDSDLESIKRRYRELSKTYHPDSGNQESGDAFIAMKKSYDLLISIYHDKG